MEQGEQQAGSWQTAFGVLLMNFFSLGAGYFFLGRWKRGLLFAGSTIITWCGVAALRIGVPYWVYLGWALFLVVHIIGFLLDSCIKGRNGKITTGRPYQKAPFLIFCFAVNLGAGFLLDQDMTEGSKVLFSIPSASMEPTAMVGDYIVSSGSFNQGWVRRGDVVVFRRPDKTYWIKRVIGLPNETFQMKAGVPHINGKPLLQTPRGITSKTSAGKNVPLLEETTPEGMRYEIMMSEKNGPLDNTALITIPAGHVFVLGDNRQNSLDSRFAGIGSISLANVVRKAELIVWSADWSRLGQWVQ